ncbi:MAG: hypothetical protein GY796_14280 [Chloroflexi bacterium]|nr:hypothetical protein [Chloroflexota bacterium]
MINPTPAGDVSVQGNLKAQNVITGGIQQNFELIFQQPFEPAGRLKKWRIHND